MLPAMRPTRDPHRHFLNSIEPYQQTLRKRKLRVEPLIAKANMGYGIGCLGLKTLRRLGAKALLITVGQTASG